MQTSLWSFHSGIGDDKYEKGEENEGYQIASCQVDAVVTGHSHAEFPSGNGTGFYEKYPGVDGVNGKINGTPVTMAGKYGDHLGVIDLKLNYTDGKWKVTDSKGSIRKVDTKSNVADQRVIDIAQESHQGTINYVRSKSVLRLHRLQATSLWLKTIHLCKSSIMLSFGMLSKSWLGRLKPIFLSCLQQRLQGRNSWGCYCLHRHSSWPYCHQERSGSLSIR